MSLAIFGKYGYNEVNYFLVVKIFFRRVDVFAGTGAGKLMNKPTIKDVAAAAGVSIATVSRVLNHNPKVNDEMTERVNQAVRKLGYYPNLVARTLKNEGTKTIGFVVSDIANSFFTIMARSVEDVLSRHGYNMIVCSTDDNQQREMQYLSWLREKQADGIIINISGKNNDLITEISTSTPVVLFSRKITDPAFVGDLVDNDNFTGLYDLTAHLINLGHQRIGLINGQPSVSSSQERLAGFTAAMRTIGVAADESYDLLYSGHFNRLTSGASGAQYLYEKGATAIIAANNLLALGALQFCRQHHVSVPETLSLASFGTIANHELLYVQPTCVEQSPSSMGTRLGQLMIERIEHKNQISNREIRFATTLILGNSTRAL